MVAQKAGCQIRFEKGQVSSKEARDLAYLEQESQAPRRDLTRHGLFHRATNFELAAPPPFPGLPDGATFLG